jgi:hypothetical protein
MKIPLSVSIILSGYFVSFAASAQSSLPFNHPKDQIAIQLGAIQMGYTVPFQLVSGNSTNSQQAANALVMGRNALDATVAKPAAKVEGFKDSPSVDTIEYRDQLYQAVEAVVISPVIGQVKGSATLVGGKKQTATAKFTVPPNAYTIPVPFALEAATSVDAQALSSNLTAAQATISSLSGNFTTIQSQNTALSSSVAAVSSNLTTAQATIATMTDQIQALREELVAVGVLSAGGGGGGNATATMITVQGGTLPQSSFFAGQTVSTFQIGIYEVTWGEWKTVRDWAVANGYTDLAGVGETYPGGSADNFPVCYVNWYDVCKWSNARSEKEGLTPVYQVGGATYRTGSSVPTVNSVANGYRLPIEKEWEWAARGGVSSQGYTYSGSNDVNAVAWYPDNSNGGTKAVGTKAANELGIYEMSGNAHEWCWDVYYSDRRLRGGSWSYGADFCTVATRGSSAGPGHRGSSVGFRLARSSGN